MRSTRTLVAFVVASAVGVVLLASARGGAAEDLAPDVQLTTFGFEDGRIFVNDLNDAGVLVGYQDLFGIEAVGWIRDADGAVTVVDHPDAFLTELDAINERGDAVGRVRGDGFELALVRSAEGASTTFGVPGASATRGRAVNDLGEVAGMYRGEFGSPWRGFIRAVDGTITLVDYPMSTAAASVGGRVLAINNSGDIAGQYVDDAQRRRSFVRSTDGVYAPVDVPGALETYVLAMNEAGDVAGVYTASPEDDPAGVPVQNGFIRKSDGTYTVVAVPAATGTRVRDINDAGVVVGEQLFTGPGFVRLADGQMITIASPSPGSSFSIAAINNLGKIAGVAVESGEVVGFVATVAKAQNCDGHPVTVRVELGEQPTSGDDVILGTAGADVIAAGEGDDVICARGGDDRIYGQAGDDTILGGDGDDVVRGGGGNDDLRGDDGADDVSGGRGDDLVDGGSGDDVVVRGGTGDDTVSGGEGNDALVAGNGGEDTVMGGDGDDKATGGPRPDVVWGGGGDDEVKGLKGADELFGGTGDDTISGGHQPDTIDGGEGIDACNGGLTGGDAVEADTATNCETMTNVP